MSATGSEARAEPWCVQSAHSPRVCHRPRGRSVPPGCLSKDGGRAGPEGEDRCRSRA